MAELVMDVRRERDRRRAAGQESDAVEQHLQQMGPLADQAHALVVVHAIRVVVEQRGGGPYPAEELATIAGVSVADLRRVLVQLVRDGLVTPADQPPDAPPS